MSLNGPRSTNNREMEKLRWSLKIEEISSWIDTITTDLREILRDIQDLLLLR